MKVLRIRSFRNLWLGQTVSQLGDAIYGLLFIFMADRITQRPEIVGLVGAATALPFLVVSPFAGVVADRVDRRKIMLFSDLASVAVLLAFAGLVAQGAQPPLWSLFVVPFLLSTVNAFFMPARGAAIPSLVGEADLMPAMSLSSATMHLMHTVGLIFAAVLLGPLEAVNPSRFFLIAILANAATFLVSAVFVSKLPPLSPMADGHEPSHALTDLREGFRLVSKNRVLVAMFASNFVVSLSVSGFMVVYTATNRLWFDGTFATLALVELSFLVAMVVSSLLVPRFKVSKVGIAYAAVLAFVGLDVVALGWARSVPLYVVGNILAGLALPFVNIPWATYMNLAVSSEYRGRLNSFAAMISMGVQPLGTSASGFGLRVFGVVGMYVAMGAALTVAALAPLVSRDFREARMPGSGNAEGELAPNAG